MLLLGISKAQFLTLPCFYPHVEGGRSRRGVSGCPGRAPSLLLGFSWASWDPSCCRSAATGRGRRCCKRIPGPGPGWKEQRVALQENCCAVGTGKCRHWGGSRKNASVHVCVHRALNRRMGWDCTLSFPLHVSWPSDGGRVDLPTQECSQRKRSMIQPP